LLLRWTCCCLRPLHWFAKTRLRARWDNELQELLPNPRKLALTNKDLCERLRLEVWMRMMMPEFFAFLILLSLLIATLNQEASVGDIYELRQKLHTMYALDSLQEVEAFSDVYQFLYNYVDASESLDPLNRELYVNMTVSEDGKEVTLQKTRPFFQTMSMVMPPLMATSRADRIFCDGFADETFDRVYSLRRIEYQYGLEPWRVNLVSDEGHEQRLLAARESQSAEWGSTLLTCVDRSKTNGTMPAHLAEDLHNEPMTIEGQQFFGDVTISKRDILAYMGYNVNYPNLETHPDCVFPEPVPLEAGVETDPVTPDNVAERCEFTGKMWLDQQTQDVRVRSFFYTPVLEYFTMLDVQIKVSQTGALQPSSRIHTFQQLNRTSRFAVWQSLMVVLLLITLLQFALMIRRMRKKAHYRKTFPSLVGRRTKSEVFSDAGCVTLHVFVLAYVLVRISQGTFSADIWDILGKLDSARGNMSGLEIAEELMVKIDHQEVQVSVSFIVILWSIMQLINYLSVHPRMGLLWNTIQRVLDELVHFVLVFFLLLFMLCMLGTLCFGAHLEEFSSLGKTLATGVFWALGQFEQGSEGDLPTWQLRVLYWIWVITYLVVMFLFLLNFLLAIVVEGYGGAIKVYQDMVCEENFMEDVWILCWFQAHFRLFRWPSRTAILEVLVTLPPSQTQVTFEDILPAFAWRGTEEKTKAEAARFLLLYSWWMPQLEVGDCQQPRLSTRAKQHEELHYGSSCCLTDEVHPQAVATTPVEQRRQQQQLQQQPPPQHASTPSTATAASSHSASSQSAAAAAAAVGGGGGAVPLKPAVQALAAELAGPQLSNSSPELAEELRQMKAALASLWLMEDQQGMPQPQPQLPLQKELQQEPKLRQLQLPTPQQQPPTPQQQQQSTSLPAVHASAPPPHHTRLVEAVPLPPAPQPSVPPPPPEAPLPSQIPFPAAGRLGALPSLRSRPPPTEPEELS